MTAKQTMLPLSSTHKNTGGSGSRRVQPWTQRWPEYVRRAVNYPQMDIDYTFWQMVYLCISPAKVYRTTKYHRQTKNQWARDDPAFVTILVLFMCVSSLAYAIAFHRGAGGFFRALLHSVLVNFFGVGALLSSLLWWVANSYLRVDSTGTHTTEQKVEWMYAFDVHCNSYFPFFMFIDVAQYFMLPLFMRTDLLWTVIANLFHAAALSYYIFVTFLGYDILPFLQHTSVLLYPIVPVALFFVVLSVLRVNVYRTITSLFFT